MGAMRILVVLLVGCAHQTAKLSDVRDTEGQPLPTTARLDADTGGAQLHCPERSYWIVESPPPYLTGNRAGTSRVVITDAPLLCAKIRSAGE